MITAFWEAYCEDIAAEGLEHLVTHASDASKTSHRSAESRGKGLKQDQHELAMWRLADEGWRIVLSSRLTALQAERNRKLNTPKTDQIDELFLRAVGISKMSSRWYWEGMSADNARTKLDNFVTLRGEIAHRGAARGKPTKAQVTGYYGHVKRLVSKTGGAVNSAVKKATGIALLT